MVIRVERLAVRRAPDHAPRLFETLLDRVVAELAEGLPVATPPEQFLSGFDTSRIATFFGLFEPMRHDVINYEGLGRPIRG